MKSKEFREVTLTDLKNEFKNPSSGFRPVALWFWNGRLCEDEIRRQMVELKKGGVGGVVIHARSGHDVEYLSDRWWDMMAAAVEAARENDLAVWCRTAARMKCIRGWLSLLLVEWRSNRFGSCRRR